MCNGETPAQMAFLELVNYVNQTLFKFLFLHDNIQTFHLHWGNEHLLSVE